jgi:hypothetical protein
LAPFRSLLERFVPASGLDIHRLRKDVVAYIRKSRYRTQCVNELIDECICRGGPDGLVTAIEVLVQLDPKVVLAVAWKYFYRDSNRWRQLAKVPHMRYSVRDEAWYILLRTVCQSADHKEALALLLVALAAGPDAIREGAAAAAATLVERVPDLKRILAPILQSLLEEPTEGVQPVSRTSKNAIRDALEDMGG